MNYINPDKLLIMNAFSAYRVKEHADKIISILDPNSPNKEYFIESEKNKVLFFDDVENNFDFHYQAPNYIHIHEILEFVKKINPNETVIIHCEAGRSRSTAVAIGVLIYSGLSIKDSISKVFQIRPKAIPNNLIVQMFEKELKLEFDEIIDILEEKYQNEGFSFDWEEQKFLSFKDDNDDIEMYKKYIQQIKKQLL